MDGNVGIVKQVVGNVLHLTHPNGPATKRDVVANATVTLNGKPAKLADLKLGDSVEVANNPVSSIVAKR